MGKGHISVDRQNPQDGKGSENRKRLQGNIREVHHHGKHEDNNEQGACFTLKQDHNAGNDDDHEDMNKGLGIGHGTVLPGEVFGKHQDHSQLHEFRRLNGVAPQGIKPGFNALGPVKNRSDRQQDKSRPVEPFRTASEDIVREGHNYADDKGSHQDEKALLHRVGRLNNMIQERCVFSGIGRIGSNTDSNDSEKSHGKNKRNQNTVHMCTGMTVFSDRQAESPP